MTTMRISQLAERTGVPATTLRFYEDAGLLTADRTAAGYRVYGEDAVRRLTFIGAAKNLGLPLEEIGELLAVWQSGACAEVKADLRPRLAARVADAEQRAADLAALTSTLHSALDHLDALPNRSGPCGPECGFLSPVAAPPVACSLTGEAVGERTGQWHDALDGAVRQHLDHGIRLTVPTDRITVLAELAAAEQRCCPFFDFRLLLDGPRVHLEVRAPAEGASMLTDLFLAATSQ